MSDIRDLLDEMGGFFAYEQGSTDSGVKNDVRRAEVVALLDALPAKTLRIELSQWLRDSYLSDKGLAEGYGWVDALEFLKFVDDGWQV